METVNIEMCSVRGEPLAGDLVVMFDDSSARVPEAFLYWLVAVPVFVGVGLLAALLTERKVDDNLVEVTRLLNKEEIISFLPEFCLLQGRHLTAFVLAQLGQLSVVFCGSAGFHIRTVALFSFFFCSSRFSGKR